jgi:zinc/manganese transport system substrate-binding protein
MKRKTGVIVSVLVLLYVPASLMGKSLSVVTTTTDLAAIARAVGGKRVRVKSIAKGSQDPHYVAAKPSYMRLLNRADLLLYVGLELEAGWLPLLVQGARNPGLVSVNLSQGISVLEVPRGEISRAQGDIHPDGNPHYWLAPGNGLIVARRIAGQLKALAPGDSAYFEDRLRVFEKDVGSGIQEWERRLMPYRGQEVVAYHKQWEYLARWLGLVILGYVEDKPGIPPAPRHVSALIRTMNGRKVKTLLVASFINPTIPRSVAGKAGAKMVMLPASVGAERGGNSYRELFEVIVGRLEGVLK